MVQTFRDGDTMAKILRKILSNQGGPIPALWSESEYEAAKKILSNQSTALGALLGPGYVRIGDSIDIPLGEAVSLTGMENPVLGEELLVNGDFTTDLSGWTITSSASLFQWEPGGGVRKIAGVGFPQFLDQTVSVAEAGVYIVRVEVSQLTVGNIGSSSAFGGVTLSPVISSVETREYFISLATSGAKLLRIWPLDTAAFVIRRISIKRLVPASLLSPLKFFTEASPASVGELRVTSLGIGIGKDALSGGANNNIAIGHLSMLTAKLAVDNIAIGHGALAAVATGKENVGIGTGALALTKIGVGNIVIGKGAAASLASGDYNIVIGPSALATAAGGNASVAIGNRTLEKVTSGSQNVAVGGVSCGSSLTLGGSNALFGSYSGSVLKTGSYNVFLGNYAGQTFYDGDANVAIGHAALGALSSVSAMNRNVAIGYRAGVAVIGGADNNILIGYQAGDNITSGARNIIIGYDLNASSATASNTLSIAGVITGTGINTAATSVISIPSTVASTNTTTGALTVAGGLGVAGRISAATANFGGTNGTTLDLLASATATLDFPEIAAGASSDLTITVTGAATGDAVCLGLPASPAAGIVFQGFVSAANIVTVRATNITASPVDPGSASYRATVLSF
jgi:hypothetical protein